MEKRTDLSRFISYSNLPPDGEIGAQARRMDPLQLSLLTTFFTSAENLIIQENIRSLDPSVSQELIADLLNHWADPSPESNLDHEVERILASKQKHHAKPPAFTPPTPSSHPKPTRPLQPVNPKLAELTQQIPRRYRNLSLQIKVFSHLARSIANELQENLSQLMTLNPSRRRNLLRHLLWLGGMGLPKKGGDPSLELQKWLEGPLGGSQKLALEAYLEEVALIYLGQALLLKSWSDRNIQKWKESDLDQLNWTLSDTLRKRLPMNREGWQITQPNLYSWYRPSKGTRTRIWEELNTWQLGEEGPQFLSEVLTLCQKKRPQSLVKTSFDSRFFVTLWNKMEQFGLKPSCGETQGPIRRPFRVFTPTLRDGAFLRAGPPNIETIGLEAHPFKLFLAELCMLWDQPKCPPLWTVGSGLESFHRPQLSLNWNSPRPSLQSQIAEMEACQLSFVLEESSIRTSGKTVDSANFRELVETIPQLKKLKTGSTTLGGLQACVAITKLRPGGLLWWLREEPISESDSQDMIRFLLNQGKLLCEWNLSSVTHQLPLIHSLFPCHMYLFQREVDPDQRRNHRPIEIKGDGFIRSHVEVPQFFSELLESYQDQTFKNISSPWTLLRQQSPTPQSEWAEKWPTPMDTALVNRMNQLRTSSIPLGQLTSIVKVHQHASGGSPLTAPGFARPGSLTFFVRKVDESDDIRLKVSEEGDNGFLVYVPHASWIPVLSLYLESDLVSDWLKYACEKKGKRWILNEQNLKFIPIPTFLSSAIKSLPQTPGNQYLMADLESKSQKNPEKLVEEYHQQLKNLQKTLSEDQLLEQKLSLFIRGSQHYAQLGKKRDRLSKLVKSDGTIQWGGIFQILPKNSLVSFPLHPSVQLKGNLGPHSPIQRIEKKETPHSMIVFQTESGMRMEVRATDITSIAILWDQVRDLLHPTWHELVEGVFLPRSNEIVQNMAKEILASYHSESYRLSHLRELLSVCLKI